MDTQNEFKRLLNLSDFDLDYESLEKEFIDLNRLAAKIAGTEISQLNLIDHFTQWSVSQVGTKDLQTPREESICTYTVLGKEKVEILDLSKDSRLKNIDSIKSAGAKYYFGIPLISNEGFSIGTLCVISLKTITLSVEQKELLTTIANEIVKRLESLRQTNKLKKENSSLKTANREMVHDLRGMVSGVMGLGDLIHLENGGKSKKIDDYLKLHKGTCKSIVEYAENILSNVVNDGDTNLTNVEKLSEKLERLYLPLAIKKGISFKVFFNDIDTEVSFEDKMIIQIVGNLISNAMKFTPKHGNVEVGFKLINKGKLENTDREKFNVQIIVNDSGVGMSEQRVNEILKDNSNSTEGTKGEQGFGLGLTLVQHHISTLDGTISIDSKPEQGSTFTVEVPII